jgi:L-seryl-tRNA(Ser) seleniumtransferase
MENEELRKLPSVDRILGSPELTSAIDQFGLPLLTHAARSAVDRAREGVVAGKSVPSFSEIIASTLKLAKLVAEPSLKRVINATGVVLHTNLGRAPLGQAMLDEIAPVLTGYSNLEFDLDKGDRGDRASHCVELLKFLTGAEDALIVNNNAAAVILILSTFAKRKEVVVSRGELIEIGGAFRIPEIMATSGSKMVEVGTTNRTRRGDYDEAITDKTAILFKAHKSNYAMTGFVEEVSTADLAALATSKGLISAYDIGSGLLRKPDALPLDGEPDIVESLKAGVDLVCFSGDKLLGGPQAGIIVGRRDLIRKLAKAPLMRALRPGKLTIAALSAACRTYLTDERLMSDNPAFAMLSTSLATVTRRAEQLQAKLTSLGVDSIVVESSAQVGGGSLPDVVLTSKAVSLATPEASAKNPGKYAERIHRKLLGLACPVVGVLREGRLLFDVLTVFDSDIEIAASEIAQATSSGKSPNIAIPPMKHLIMGTAGHVDHGKTAPGARVDRHRVRHPRRRKAPRYHD